MASISANYLSSCSVNRWIFTTLEALVSRPFPGLGPFKLENRMMFRASLAVMCGLSATATLHANDHTDRPWQYDDGTIVYLGQVFKGWKEYYASDVFDPSQKCGTPEPIIGDDADQGPVQGFGGFSPSDCTTSSTTISSAYDPIAGIYRIPVVFHVIRDSNGSQGNLSEACVQSQIRILNEDFNGIAGSPGEDGVESRIEFYLADVDPNGNPTNGITFSNNSTWYNDSGSYWNSLAWDTNRYMNIYSNTAGGNLGYVPGFPQQGLPGQAQDRVVVLWTTVGDCATLDPYDLGRTVTHEVGHYLGLYHTFQGGCGSSACYNSGDLVCDTAAEQSSTFGCPTGSSSCGSLDPIDNYMDYSDDPCMRRFTPEQANRMRCALVNYRPDLYDDGPLSISFPGGLPSTIPSSGTDLVLETTTQSGVRVDAVAVDYQFTNSGSSGSVDASSSSNTWTMTLPASPLCPDVVQFSFRIDLDNGETVEEGPFSALVNDGYDVAEEWNGNSAGGWTLGLPTDTAVDGQWGQGNPAGGGERGDPANDADGSGGCFLTDNVSGNSDVDDGITTLLSPIFDATGLNDPIVSYRRWYSNDFGADPNNDVMPIEISNNGGSSWTLLENVTENAGVWVYREFTISDYVTPSSNMQLRFIAGDLNAGSVVEAGIDELRVGSISCKNAPEPPSNDDCSNAIVISDGTTAFNTLAANDSGFGVPLGCSTSNGPSLLSDIWFEYTAPCLGTVNISSCGLTDFDVRAAIYDTSSSDCPNGGTSVLACGDDDCGTDFNIEFLALEGQVFKIRVGSTDGSEGSGEISVNCEPIGGNPCPADLDGSGTVDGGDMGLLLSQFGGSGSADLDGNGQVDGGDLGLLLVDWGPCSG